MAEQKNVDTGMYIIDSDYKLVNFSKQTKEIYSNIEMGQFCYNALAMRDSVCDICPIKDGNVTFYNPMRKEWINTNAAPMEYPGCGECYNIMFRRYANMVKPADASGRREAMKEDLSEDIREVQEVTGMKCAFTAYCEPGNPIIYVNEEMVHYLGYDSEEDFLVGIDGLVENMIHPDDKMRVQKDMAAVMTPGAVYESVFRMPRKDSSWVYTVIKGKTIETKEGSHVMVSACSEANEYLVRQSEVEQQNKDLLQKELTTKEVLRQMPGGYHRCANADGFPFLYFGKSFEEITGWTKEEIETEFDNKFINMVYPEDIPSCMGIVDRISEYGYSNDIYRLKKKDGGYIWVSDSTMRIHLPGTDFYHGVLADVTNFIEELETQKRLAESSSRAKSVFLFNASHDIRTPMNAIHGFTRMLKQKPGDEQFVKETVDKIEQSGNTLMKLLNDVLELSRIESGKEDVNLSIGNLKDYTKKLHTMFSQEIRDAGITLQIESEIQNPTVWYDELKVTQIGMNMLSNARKFTPAGGTITFGVKEVNQEDGEYADYRFYVKDSGIGMSKEFLSKAFETFERERTATESGVIGSGLGLSIIKKLTELMGGACTLHSELGKGTEISSILRLRIANEEKAENIAENEKESDFTGKRVLLVEDNNFNREIARYILENQGIIVEEAEDGSVAVNKMLNASAGYYDLILMDIQMPVMDGYTATKEIRQIPDKAVANVPIVAMTANAFAEDKEKCLAAGMNGHIGKPIDIEVLLKVLAGSF